MSIENNLDWNKNGLFYNFEINDEMGLKVFNWIREKKYGQFHRLIKDFEINVEKGTAPLYRIGIRFSADPFDNFLNSTSEGKQKYIEFILDHWSGIRDLQYHLITEEYPLDHPEDADDWGSKMYTITS